LQKAKKQHGNQRRPNLGLNGIGAGADKGLDLAQLLERLKEQFRLPSLLIDRARVVGPSAMIAQEHQPAFLLGVEDFHPPGKVLPAFAGQTVKANHPVGQHLNPAGTGRRSTTK
jgi:hypothetical protein